MTTPHPQRRPAAVLGSRFLACAAAVTSIVVASASPALATSAPTTHAPQSGTANVAYAGSLLTVNEQTVGPGFEHATGYSYTGRGAESLAITQEIIAGTIQPGVFESVGAAPIKPLIPKYTTWYASFAASPIVVAYNPSGPYAATFKAIAKGNEPITKLFPLMAKSGFRLGRTDPNTDPQGRAFVLMLTLAEQKLGVPVSTVNSILGSDAVGASPQIYAETSLLAHLEAGQLDAASAYRSQAIQQHLPFVTLPASINLGSPSDASAYKKATLTLANGMKVEGGALVLTITTIGGPGAPTGSDLQADQAFVAFVLSPQGRALYQKNGYTLLPVKLTGSASSVPAVIKKELPH